MVINLIYTLKWRSLSLFLIAEKINYELIKHGHNVSESPIVLLAIQNIENK